MTEKQYWKEIFEKFEVSDSLKELILKTISLPISKKDEILKNIKRIKKIGGLSLALITLFRQQVRCGFVLGDPLKEKEERVVMDKKTGVDFILSWNPDRELRKNHKMLIKRGIISEKVDKKKLVNIAPNGKPCYLCWKNIKEQNPAEIIFKIRLANEYFYIGSNFAYITNNHFTVMNSKHLPQTFRVEIFDFMFSFLDKTDSYFKIIYNGLAGASIKWHEHLQATSEDFPVQKINQGEPVLKKSSFSLYAPYYYIPLFILTGTDREKVKEMATYIIKEWENLAKTHTENLLMLKEGKEFKLYLFLRDSERLVGEGKSGAMASFEVSGRIVLSVENEDFDEREIFEKAGILWIKKIFSDIKPSEKMIKSLYTRLKERGMVK